MANGKIHLWALVWNERDMLPFFLEHYRPFVDRFYLYDDGSDDGSVEYLAEQPDVELRRFDNEGASFIEAAYRFYNHAWKESRGHADWVIVVNVDELVVCPAARQTLAAEAQRGATVMASRGWDMVTADFPRSGPLVRTANCGVHSKEMNKVAIFSPDGIEEINFGAGRHRVDPTGKVVIAKRVLNLLHYKYLGEDYLVRRYRELSARMKPDDRKMGAGFQYHAEEEKLRDHQRRLLATARPVLTQDMLASGWLKDHGPGVVEAKTHAVTNAKGGLREVWRGDDPFSGPVKQVYTTTTLPGVVKAWYRHERQVDQVFPLQGRTLLVLWNPHTPETKPLEIILDAADPRLVIVGAGIWHGFRARGGEASLLLHMNSEGFNMPRIDEDRLPEDDATIPYDWAGAAVDPV